jgi:hypothetical protein
MEMDVFRLARRVAAAVSLTAATALSASCGSPPTARTFGSMMGAQPACVLFCVIRQDIVTDSTTPPTDASTSLSTVDGPLVFNK